MYKIALVLVSLTIFLTACEDPSANKTKAKTSDPTTSNTANTNAAPANTANAAATALPITPDNSKIEWTGSKVTGSHDGGFKQFTGSINLVGDKPETSSVKVDIETDSVYTNPDQLTQHLKTPDFFDVQKFPRAS